MNKPNNDKQILIDSVIDQMKGDVANNDWTAVEELLWYVNANVLTKFLPEENRRKNRGRLES